MSAAWRADRVAFAEVAAVQAALDCPEPLAWTLVRRGLGDPAAARAFLQADGDLDPPEAIPGATDAAERLARAVRANERIVVHGDYDCDGVCSSAIICEALWARGAEARAFLPSRFTDGYGVSVENVERLADEGCQLLVCVDCGTTAVEALTRAHELGMDTIVCDHHLAGGLRPPGIIANPALGRGAEDLPAAAGVCLKVAQALDARLDGGLLAPPADRALELAALATVADAVPLRGENRRIVARGLTALREGARPGLVFLCAAAGSSIRGANARTLGFTIAPAINAAGRLDHAERGLALVIESDPDRARPLAEELWALNEERRRIEREITEAAVAKIEDAGLDDDSRAALVVSAPGWHEGVVGIVASRLVDRFGLPALVLSELPDGGIAKGSGRSLPGVDLHALVGAASERLTRWGGHQGAVGLQLPLDEVEAFALELAAAAEPARAAIARARVRNVDAVVGVRDLALPTAEALERLEPFGRGNPEVALAVPGVRVTDVAVMGDGHRSMRLRGSGAHARGVWFRGRGRPIDPDPDRPTDAVVRLGVRRWMDVVGSEVVVELLQEPAMREPGLPGTCAPACDLHCPFRAGALDRLGATTAPPPAPRGGPEPSVRDRRGEGAGLPLVAALAGADRGVAVVVADVARRRAALTGVLAPERLGVDAVLLAGVRCAPEPVIERLGAGRGGALLAMVEYERLPDLVLPTGVHLVLLDPPAEHEWMEWARHRAEGGFLHLAWGEAEVELAREVVRERLDARAAAAAAWRAIRDGAHRPAGEALDALLLGDGTRIAPPDAVGHALSALGEIGLAEVSGAGVRARPDAAPRPLAESARATALAERLDRALAYLAGLGTSAGGPLGPAAGDPRGIVGR